MKRPFFTKFNLMQRKIKEESGLSLTGVIVFVLFVGILTFITIHLIRPGYCSGRFKTAVDGIAAGAFSKTDKQIQEEILTQAGEIGVILDNEDVLIEWGPRNESLEIKLDYSYPVNLVLYNYNRQFSHAIQKKLSFPKKMIDRVDKNLKRSTNRMIDRARKAREKLEE